MVTHYVEHGFNVTAEKMPKSCTSCPFWGIDTETYETGGCTITGKEIPLDGQQDEKRMDDCPILHKPRGRKRKKMAVKELSDEVRKLKEQLAKEVANQKVVEELEELRTKCYSEMSKLPENPYGGVRAEIIKAKADAYNEAIRLLKKG